MKNEFMESEIPADKHLVCLKIKNCMPFLKSTITKQYTFNCFRTKLILFGQQISIT